MVRALLVAMMFVCGSCLAPSVGEGEAEGEGDAGGEGEGEDLEPPEGPDQVSCNCRDGTTVVACVEECVNENAKCEVFCRNNGGAFGNSCDAREAACLVDGSGPNAVVCPCPGEPDTGACTSLDCVADAAAVRDVCAASCPDASSEPICTNDDDGCARFGAPTGRDEIRCACEDGSITRICAASVCGGRANANDVCDRACGGDSFGVSSCTFNEIKCALATPEGGPTAVECHCSALSSVGACTSRDCTDDAVRLEQDCAAACFGPELSGTPFAPPTCRADDRCAVGGPPRGDDLTSCRCADDTFQTRCSIGCDLEGTCAELCIDHGGENFPQGCQLQETSCLAGGEGGANAIVCDCVAFSDSAACTSIDCADAAAVADVCARACINDDVVNASCAVADEGCAIEDIPSGPNSAVCTCGDDTVFPFCVSNCRDERVTGSCFTRCSPHGGFQEFSCEADPVCGG